MRKDSESINTVAMSACVADFVISLVEYDNEIFWFLPSKRLRRVLCSVLLFASAPLVQAGGGTVVAWGSNPHGQTNVPIELTNVVQIAAGLTHGMALREDGTVVSWGGSELGQTNVPPGLSNVIAISGGGRFSLALLADGTIVPWGSNNHGQTNIPPGKYIAMSAGLAHVVALREDRTVVAWGRGDYGLTNVPSSLAEAVAVSAGGSFNMALRPDGSVVTWGYPYFGLTNVPADITNVIAISAGDDFCFVLNSNSTLSAWGNDYYGLVSSMPTNSGFVAVSAGYRHSNALHRDGTLYGWGRFDSGNTNLAPYFSNVVAVASGGHFSIALVGVSPSVAFHPRSQTVTSGRSAMFTATVQGARPMYYQWLFNGAELPGATNLELTLPAVSRDQAGSYRLRASNGHGSVETQPGILTVVDVTPSMMAMESPEIRFAGENVVLDFKLRGSLPARLEWRKNGRLLPEATNEILTLSSVLPGDSGHYTFSFTNQFGGTNAAVELSVIPFVTWGSAAPETNLFAFSNVVAVVAGGPYLSVALRDDGTIASWGQNASGAVASNALVVAPSRSAICALQRNGRVACLGLWPDATVTANVSNLADVVSLSSEFESWLGLTREGRVYRWTARSAPVPLEVTNAVAISAGAGGVNLALRADGTVGQWNGTSPMSVPAGLTNIVAVAAGGVFLALRSDGTVSCWGTGLLTNVPAGLMNVIAIDAGAQHAAALRSDGTVAVWGNGAVTNVPPGLRYVRSLSAGGASCAAFVNDKWSPIHLGEPVFSMNGLSTSFQSVLGTSYRLERKPTLDSPQVFMFPPRPGTGESMQLTDPIPPPGGAFYQVREVQ